MTRDDLLEAVIRLYREEGEKDLRLAARLGISNKTVGRWTAGEFAPNADNAVAIARAANLDPFEALDAAGRKEMADFLERAAQARTSPDTAKPHTRLVTDDADEIYLVELYRELRDISPEETDAWLAWAKARYRSLEVERDAFSRRTRARTPKRRKQS